MAKFQLKIPAVIPVSAVEFGQDRDPGKIPNSSTYRYPGRLLLDTNVERQQINSVYQARLRYLRDFSYNLYGINNRRILKRFEYITCKTSTIKICNKKVYPF